MKKLLLIALSLSSINFVSAMDNSLALAHEHKETDSYGKNPYNPVVFQAGGNNVVMAKGWRSTYPSTTKPTLDAAGKKAVKIETIYKFTVKGRGGSGSYTVPGPNGKIQKIYFQAYPPEENR